jgi:hypothetical protein
VLDLAGCHRSICVLAAHAHTHILNKLFNPLTTPTDT